MANTPRKFLLSFAAIALAAALFFLTHDNINNDNTNIPLVLPELDETKVKPGDPGGTEFPNMDKTVYEYISPTHKPLRQEKVMPEPEQPVLLIKPIVPESVFDVIISSDNVIPNSIFNFTTIEAKNNKVEIKEELPFNELNIITIDQPDNRLLNPDNTKRARSILKYNLQIGSSKNEQDAITEWQKVLKYNRDLIGKYTYRLKMVDLGDKGLMYKVYIGPFVNYNEASSLCKKLIKRKQSCIVVNE